jgi:ATP-binding cassette subfamily B protein
MEEKKKVNFKENISEYWNLLGKGKWVLFTILLFVVIIDACQAVPKFLFKVIVDKGTEFSAGNLPGEELLYVLLILGGVYLAISVVEVIGSWVRSHLLGVLDSQLIFNMKKKYFNHIISLDHNFHTTHKTGSLISRMNRGASAIETITDSIAFNFAPLIIQLIIVGASLAYFSMAPLIVVLIITVVFILFSLILQTKQQKARAEFNRAEDLEKGNISDVFTNIDSIKYFGKEDVINARYRRLALETKRKSLKTWGWYKWMSAGQIFILMIGTFFLLFFPLRQFLAGEITLGTVVFIYSIYGNLTNPLFYFVYGIRGFSRAMADMQDLVNYGKFKNEIVDKKGAKNMKISEGEVEFRNVKFQYGKKDLFENFNLKVPKKKRVALVGHSGCGKTSLVKLLYRFYDVSEGAVLIDGKDIRDFTQESLRGEMSIVPQECILFDDSIYNNVAFSNPKATREQVMRAMRFAQLDKFTRELPDKENTIVGERGVKLSGGEKQRVSIARAILADKKILVLDEATSALDSETEHEIQKDLEKLMEGRTSIIIAHRLSTIMKADKIIVMEKGKVVQSGTHRQLINQDGQYRRLWNLQKGGYIKE